MKLSDIQEELHLKNIGPIKEANLIFKKINVIIGKNQTGKSIVGKIVQICREEDNFEDRLKAYRLEAYNLNKENINFSSNLDISKPNIEDVLIGLGIDVKSEKVKQILEVLLDEETAKQIIINQDKLKNIKDDKIINVIKQLYKDSQKLHLSTYIPAERSIIPFLSSYGINFYNKSIPLPNYIVDFAANFRLAKDEIKEIDILNSKYKFEQNEDRVYFDNNDFVDLKDASSGVQSLLPLKMVVEYLNKSFPKQYIIEEPELNLFPSEQFEIVKYMIKNSMSILFITHSPYVLSALNILLYAYKVGTLNDKSKTLVEKVVPLEYWIDPNKFSGYIFDGGKAQSIIKNGLISDNLLDDTSDNFNDIYDELSDIYFRLKND